MPSSLVITVIGPDRPGLVQSLARVINEHGGNWTRSRMAHLAGQFAGMLHVQLRAEEAEKLEAALASFSEQGMQVVIARDEGGTEASGEEPSLRTLHLNLVGQDRRGIVREISSILASHGINVEELSTEVESAPWSGEALFKADASLAAPADADLDRVRDDLESLAHDLMVEISLVRPA